MKYGDTTDLARGENAQTDTAHRGNTTITPGENKRHRSNRGSEGDANTMTEVRGETPPSNRDSLTERLGTGRPGDSMDNKPGYPRPSEGDPTGIIRLDLGNQDSDLPSGSTHIGRSDLVGVLNIGNRGETRRSKEDGGVEGGVIGEDKDTSPEGLHPEIPSNSTEAQGSQQNADNKIEGLVTIDLVRSTTLHPEDQSRQRWSDCKKRHELGSSTDETDKSLELEARQSDATAWGDGMSPGSDPNDGQPSNTSEICEDPNIRTDVDNNIHLDSAGERAPLVNPRGHRGTWFKA
jgi:hypothetical protein